MQHHALKFSPLFSVATHCQTKHDCIFNYSYTRSWFYYFFFSWCSLPIAVLPFFCPVAHPFRFYPLALNNLVWQQHFWLVQTRFPVPYPFLKSAPRPINFSTLTVVPICLPFSCRLLSIVSHLLCTGWPPFELVFPLPFKRITCFNAFVWSPDLLGQFLALSFPFATPFAPIHPFSRNHTPLFFFCFCFFFFLVFLAVALLSVCPGGPPTLLWHKAPRTQCWSLSSGLKTFSFLFRYFLPNFSWILHPSNLCPFSSHSLHGLTLFLVGPKPK